MSLKLNLCKFSFIYFIIIMTCEIKLKTYEYKCNTLNIHRWGSFENGEEGYVEFDTPIAYTMGLKTWANWVDSNVNPNMTRVFFTTMSPTHTRYFSYFFYLFISFLNITFFKSII